MALSNDQVLALNNWARTQPALRQVFDYTASQGVPGSVPPSNGLGDRLNSIAGTVDHGSPAWDEYRIRKVSPAMRR